MFGGIGFGRNNLRPETKIFVVLLQYTDCFQKESLYLIDKFLKKYFKNIQTILKVVVDNSLSDNSLQRPIATNITFISGDNAYREFTGYQKGIDFFQNLFNPLDNDFFLICNDTFYRNYGQEYLWWPGENILSKEILKDKIVGYIDSYPESISILSYKLQWWVRSSFFLMTFKNIKKIGKFYHQIHNDLFFSNEKSFFLQNAPLSANYQAFIKTWLFGDNLIENFKERWHSSGKLDRKNQLEMQSKSTCIFNEHLLSAKIQKNNIKIFNLNRNN